MPTCTAVLVKIPAWVVLADHDDAVGKQAVRQKDIESVRQFTPCPQVGHGRGAKIGSVLERQHTHIRWKSGQRHAQAVDCSRGHARQIVVSHFGISTFRTQN